MAAPSSSVSFLLVKDEPLELPLDSPPTPIKAPLLRVKPEPGENTPSTFFEPSNPETPTSKDAPVSNLSVEGSLQPAQQEASAASKQPEANNAALQDETTLLTADRGLGSNAPKSVTNEASQKNAPFSEARAQLLKVTERMSALENNGAGGGSEQTGDEIRELRQLAAQSVTILSQLLQMEPVPTSEASDIFAPQQNDRKTEQEGLTGEEKNLDQQSKQSLAPQECAALLSESSPPVKEEASSKGSVSEQLILDGQETLTAGGTKKRPSPEAANTHTRQSFVPEESQAAVENLPNPGLFDGQAGPQTPPKVCAKTKWSEERPISPPLVHLDSSLEVQSQIGAENWEQEEDVGSGLEDNDDGFESEPEMEEPQEEEPAFEVPPVAQLFCGESDEEAAANEQSESEEERPEKKRKVPKKLGKKTKAGKKLPIGNATGGTPAKAKGARVGGPINRKQTEPIDAETKRFLQSLERQFKRSFTRAMLPSHVGGGYWLGISKKVGDQYMELGKYDVEFVAEGRSDIVVWLYRPPANKDLNEAGAPEKRESIGFSGGWIHCAIAHDLVVGDIVLFEKINLQKFRLHIFRKKDFRGDAAKAAAAATRLAEQLDGASTGARKAGAGKFGKGPATAGKKKGLGAQKPKKGAAKKPAESASQKGKRKALAQEEEEIERLKDLLNHKREETQNASHHLAQTRLTDIYPVVKEGKGLLSKELASNMPAGSLGMTAGNTGGVNAASGGSSGEKRVKCTPKRRVPSDSGKKRSLSELVDSPLPKKAKFEESAEPQSVNGRPLHYVDGGHRYVEASESNQRKAKQAMESCETKYPSFKVVASKSHVNKGFWLHMGSFCRENNVLSEGLAALVDAQGGVWHTRIKKEGSLSGGWRGFSIDHKLEVGDGLVFEMVLPSVFRVRIFRASKAGKEDDCSAAGGAYKDVGIGGNEKEKHKMTAEQKKALAQILDLPGGLRKPTQSVEFHPPPSQSGTPATPYSPSDPSRVKLSKSEEGRSQAKLSHGAASVGGSKKSLKEAPEMEQECKGPSAKEVMKKRKKMSKGPMAKEPVKGATQGKLKATKSEKADVPRSPKKPPKVKKEFLHFEEDPKNWDHTVNRPRHCEEKTGRIYTEPSLEQQEAAAASANRAAKSIPKGTPYCVLDMKTSHVDRRFWRGLPHTFVNEKLQHLKLGDEVVYLQNARGFLWETMLLKRKSGLSGGWRGFSCDHELEFGDHIILELLKSDGGKRSDAPRLTFGVRIFRAKWNGKEDDCKEFDFKGGRGTVLGTTTPCESPSVSKGAGLSKKKKQKDATLSKKRKQKRKVETAPKKEESSDFETSEWVNGIIKDEVSAEPSVNCSEKPARAQSLAGLGAKNLIRAKEENVVERSERSRSVKRASPAVSKEATAGSLDERPSKKLREKAGSETTAAVGSNDRTAVKVEKSPLPKMLVTKRAAPKSNAELMMERLKMAM